MGVTVDEVVLQLEAKIDKYNADVTLAFKNFDKRMDQMKQSARNMERTTSAAFRGVKAGLAGLLGSLSIDAFIRVAKAGLDYAASLGDIAKQAGVSTKFLQEFRYAAIQNGSSVTQADAALTKFSQTIGNALGGNKAAVESFKSIGVSMKELNAATEQGRFEIVANAIAKIPDPARQTAVALQIFGDEAKTIIPLLGEGAEGFRKLAYQAEEFGLILSERDIQNADITAKKIDQLTQALQVRIAGVVAENAAAIGALAEQFANLADKAFAAINAMVQFSQSPWGKFLNDINRLARLGSAPGLIASGLQAAAGGRGGSKTPFVDAVLQGDPSAAQPAAKAGRGPITPVASSHRQRKGRADHTAEKLLRDQEAIDREIFSAKVEELRARNDLTTNAADRVDIAHQLLDLETQQRSAQIDSEAKQRKLEFPLRAAQIEAEREVLHLLNDQVDKQKRALIDREAQLGLVREQTEALEDNRDTLDAAKGLASTAASRLEIELEILDLQDQIEKNRLEEAIATGEIADAERARANLLTRQAARRAEAKRDGESPLQQYRRRLGDEAADLNTSIEDAEVRALQRMEESLAGSVKQALNLHGVFGDLIGDLIQIAIRQLIIKQIVDAMGDGSGGGGGGGGFFSSLFRIGTTFASAASGAGGTSRSGVGRASGGGVSAGMLYRVNENGIEGFRPAQSGTVIPLGQMPNAVSPAQAQAPIARVRVELSGDLDARIVSVSGSVAVETVRAAAPEIVNASVNETFRQGGRSKL